MSEKRLRVGLACLRCRQRRLKCSGDNPCASCAVESEACEYPDPDKKRGLPAGTLQTLRDQNTALQTENATLKRRIVEIEAAAAVPGLPQIAVHVEVPRPSLPEDVRQLATLMSHSCANVSMALLLQAQHVEGLKKFAAVIFGSLEHLW